VVEMEGGSNRPIVVREDRSCVVRRTELARREGAVNKE